MKEPTRVLLIEDNAGDADFIKETLEASRPEIEISVAIDGTQALAHLRHESPYEQSPRPDFIILDLNLPKVDGRQVLAKLKKNDQLRGIPVVVFTSSDSHQDIAKSYDLGANCYVTKPVGLAESLAAIRAIESFWLRAVKLP